MVTSATRLLKLLTRRPQRALISTTDRSGPSSISAAGWFGTLGRVAVSYSTTREGSA